MLKNYLKIAYRNLWKNKLFSFINIFGLGLAIPFALLSLLQLQGSFEGDNFHPHADRIFRIITDQTTVEAGKLSYASTPFPMANKLKQDYPGIDAATKVHRAFGWEMNNKLKYLDVNVLYVEPSFFDLFGFYIEKGSVPTEPFTLVITQDMATRFFNEMDPIGKFLYHPTYGGFLITGILKQFKKQTQFRSDVMVSMTTLQKLEPKTDDPDAWSELNAHTFVRLKENSSTSSLQTALEQLKENHNTKLVSKKLSNRYRIQSLTSISPDTENLRNNPYVEDMQDIYFNFGIPLMILLLAGFNYTNLTLARSLNRSKEVGIRKVAGALRSQLIIQFIIEALLIAFVSLLLGLTLLTFMRSFIHVQWVTWEVDNTAAIYVLFIVFALVLGVLSGLLPALILSKFQPVEVLKGLMAPRAVGRVNFRKSLIVIQFVVTLGFVFMIGHFYNQFNYMATENENYRRQGILNLTLTSDKNPRLLANTIQQHAGVQRVGFVSTPFGANPAEIKLVRDELSLTAYYYAADRQFIENMNLQFVAGENLYTSVSDSASRFVLVNEEAVQRFGLGTPKEAIGKILRMNGQQEIQIIGVLKDFCHFHYQYKKEPIVFQYNPSNFGVLSVQTKEPVSRDEMVTSLLAAWKTQNPHDQMVHSWYDEELYLRYYPAEDMKMMGLAALVILIIAVMGLLAMVIFTTEKRNKEIGIRKVMGAGVTQITRLLAWSFIKLLLWAGIIGIPLGVLSGSFFHSVFVYHTELNYGLMFVLFIFILLIALGTVIYFSARAALSNPVKVIRTE